MGFLIGLATKFKAYMAAAGGLIIILAVTFFKGRAAGKDAANARTAAKELEDAHTVQNERTKAERLNDDDVDKEFDKWSR